MPPRRLAVRQTFCLVVVMALTSAMVAWSLIGRRLLLSGPRPSMIMRSAVRLPEAYSPTWREWYEALVIGGDTQFTRGKTSRVCTDVPPVQEVEAGAFIDPARFWSTASTVEFGGTHYVDGKPRIVDVRAPCCRSEHRWPKCWADDTGRRGDHDLDSIKADARSLARVGILHASLEGNVLSLTCARGPGTGQYAESVGAFQWKPMPDSTNVVRNVTSSAVVVRCECSRGLLQRLR